MNIEEEIKEMQEFVDMYGSRADREDFAIIKNFIKKQQEDIKEALKNSDRWFKEAMLQREEKYGQQEKLEKIINNLITALAEERGTDEDEIREVFLNAN